MVKVRIFKTQNGVVLNYPNPNKFTDDQKQIDDPTSQMRSLSDCPIPDDLLGLDFITLDESDMPFVEDQETDYHEMIYFDGECTKENLKQDKEWSVQLMPNFLVKDKYLKKKREKISEELAKETPDNGELAKLNSEIYVADSKDHDDDEFWTQKAIEGLDERVSNGESDKPEIRKKLQDKLK